MSGPSGRTRNKKQRTAACPDTTAEILRRIQSSRVISREETLHIFHLDKPSCHGCRVNAKDSPLCLCGLAPTSAAGTRKHGLWQKLGDVVDGVDPTKQLREDADVPSGLTNLGATCYVNSVLQCLYMNTEFRDGVFATEAELLREQPVLHQLARLFAQLHSGKRLSVDSAEFANTLELDNAIQQDGQEFLKLLLTLLERILSQSRVPEARSVVQNLFRGTFSYVTKCSSCGKESDSSNQFVDFYELELNVKGFSGLETSLDDYLSEDKLQGENQYFCQHCKARVDATHSTKLRLLPPVLNFQLKRFVFNSKTATKKKVTSKFSFPKVLDMSSRVSSIDTENVTSSVYDLSAILVHKGSMANSGHYIARIRDDRTGLWWQFDDEEVTTLGSEPLASESGKETPSSKDELMSADAYMLTYSRRPADSTTGVATTESVSSSSREQRARRSQQFLPEQLRAEVEDLNAGFVNTCMSYQTRKEEQAKHVAERKEEVRRVLASAPVNSTSSPFYWISYDWLRTWADSLPSPSPIDNNPLLCEHNAVSPKKISLTKCITETAWVTLHSKYGGGPELTIDNCCSECIYEDADASASADSFRNERASMKVVAENAMAGQGLIGELFYVSRTWLLQWMRRKTADALSDADADPTGAITCSHGGLLPEAPGAKRQEVPKVLWSYFLHNALQAAGERDSGRKAFPVGEDETCCICEAEMSQVVDKQEGIRATRMEERHKQEAVYSGKNFTLVPRKTYYLVPSTWIMQWRAYVGASGKNMLNHEPPTGLQSFIDSFICDKHGRLLYKPPQLSRTKRGELVQKNANDDEFTAVSDEDWQFFCERWEVEPSKGIKAVIDEDNEHSDGEGAEGEEAKPSVLRTEPEVCRQCIEDRESTELIRKLSYTNETISVELIEGTEPPKALLVQTQATEPDRRTSKRTRRSGGNKRTSLTVSGSTTVYHLKLLIWECHGVVKENQKVHFGRKELTDELATLADLGILPGSQLWVIDTGLHENRDIAEELPLLQGDKVEEGFRGTRLLDLGVSAAENGDGVVSMDVCRNAETSSRHSSEETDTDVDMPAA